MTILKSLILDSKKIQALGISLVILFSLAIQYFELNNTIQSKLLIATLYLIGLYVMFVKYQARKEKGLPILTWNTILPAILVLSIFLFYYYK